MTRELRWRKGRTTGRGGGGMSLVLAGVEVAAGGLKDQVSIPVYLQHGEEEEEEKERNGFFIADKVDEESSETSSIGVQSSDSSSEKDGELGAEEEEVQSKAKVGAFSSLDSLEESLPIKRGLSNFYSGKSKSFASLADVATAAAKDLVKPENPFNKRRRLIMASKSRSYTSLLTSLPPLLSADHIAEEEEEEEDDRNSGDSSPLLPPLPLPLPLPPLGNRGRHISKAFRSPRSFSLSDLQNV